MSSLFGTGAGAAAGGSNSSSSNQAFGSLQQPLTSIVGQGSQAGGQLANMLGLNGGSAQNQGFTNWQNSTGYQFGKQQGMDSITGNAATQGLLNSGGTLKAMDTFGQNYANTQYGNYTSMLQNLLGSGISGGSALAQAGNTTKSTTTNDMFSQGGVPAGIGMLLGK